MPPTRVRRSPAEARALILEAAEGILIEGGPSAVQMRAVAQRLDMTDAGVAHHFGSRAGLLVELLRHGGRRIRDAVAQATEGWVANGETVAYLVDRVATVYEDGYGELAVALHAAGWRDEGTGMLDPVVEALHAARRRRGGRPRREDTRLAVAALHQALATDPSYGAAFRRSAGIAADAAADPTAQRRWWARTLTSVLGLD
ncbi:TetR/AcrR family transcriptional regulator [Solihabitans fulvus]|uniref:TetR/AcrR family transcriptional regulator n=1 Tax=Solihabitans fulvus TaxID=1892852 RepID=A0A5B2X2N8_9PSEU|nr:helix-turn-helix domain-containing protein [Solihabitans fulvus]KAA2257536.1 TetR/AcrR family transcriptional regulator [Solihabitans fulvus]